VSSILIVDEATASIDHASDTQVQAILSGLDATTVTVAHRLATVADHDRIIVLDHGAIIEQGAPWALLRNPQSAFRAMCEMSGEFDRLVHISECARRARNIVDIDFFA
jgi:ABC-type multidrug transport system fused ATPase/permease subunit